MMPDPLVCALFLTATFVVAGVAHSLWLRTAASRRLLIPLDGGLQVRGRRVFGENKTVRGFVVLVPAASFAFVTGAALARSFAPQVADALWPLTAVGFASLGAWAGLGF